MSQQTMNLLLKLAVNLIEHFEPKEMIANSYLVALIEQSFGDELTINQSAIGRFKISYAIARDHGFRIVFSPNARVQSRGTKVVDAHIGFDGTPKDDIVTLKRNWHSHQFATQENQRWPALARGLAGP